MKEFTEDEKIVARSMGKRYKWVARDKFGNLFVFSQKPHKGFGGVWVCESVKWDDMFVFNEMFETITWEDEEPTLIKDIYDPQILDDAEKRYLTDVLKPLPKVKEIWKSASLFEDRERLVVSFCIGETMQFPRFVTHTMYKNMEREKPYTLEELGINLDRKEEKR